MPRRPGFRQCIEDYIVNNKKCSKNRTYRQYKTVLNKFSEDLKKGGYDPSPFKIDENSVLYLINVQWKDIALSTKRWYTFSLNRYLKYFGNDSVENLHIVWPQDMRPNVDWLTDYEQQKLLNEPMSPLEEIVIHLELNLGLRIAEVCNIRVDMIDRDKRIVEILGKGKGEGKWRSVPFSKDTERILDRWMVERNNIIRRMNEHNPSWKDPGNLLLWCRYIGRPHAGHYSDRGHSIDRGVIYKLRDRLGMNFSNHTLRRTFGRTLFHAGVRIETISKIMGHDDTVTTIKYLGVNLDDMEEAIELHSDYQKKIKVGLAGKGTVPLLSED